MTSSSLSATRPGARAAPAWLALSCAVHAALLLRTPAPHVAAETARPHAPALSARLARAATAGAAAPRASPRAVHAAPVQAAPHAGIPAQRNAPPALAAEAAEAPTFAVDPDDAPRVAVISDEGPRVAADIDEAPPVATDSEEAPPVAARRVTTGLLAVFEVRYAESGAAPEIGVRYVARPDAPRRQTSEVPCGAPASEGMDAARSAPSPSFPDRRRAFEVTVSRDPNALMNFAWRDRDGSASGDPPHDPEVDADIGAYLAGRPTRFVTRMQGARDGC